jgi:TRAP-type C4-dicarboxylate transport system permease small subunit
LRSPEPDDSAVPIGSAGPGDPADDGRGGGSRARRVVEKGLEACVLTLIASLAIIVVVGVVFRKFGAALVWYDEVASIVLAWLTYYGAALAALKRAHIGVPTVVQQLHGRWRLAAVLFAESVVIGFFVAVAWAGWQVLQVLGGTTLISLPWVPARLAQSVIPIGAALFILAQILSAPDVLRAPTEGASARGATVETGRAEP